MTLKTGVMIPKNAALHQRVNTFFMHPKRKELF